MRPSAIGVGTEITAKSKPAIARRSAVGRYRPVSRRGRQTLVGDVLDVGAAGGRAVDLGGVELEADDVESDLDGPDGDGQAHIALADDDDALDSCAFSSWAMRVVVWEARVVVRSSGSDRVLGA